MATIGYRLREQHEPSWRCDDLHCYSHNVDELRIGRPYRVCGECFHVYPTRYALRRDYRRGGRRVYWEDVKTPLLPPPALWVAMGMKPQGKTRARLNSLVMMIRPVFLKTRNITFCPHCIHDF